jgi:Protein of unknown function (DUF3455)
MRTNLWAGVSAAAVAAGGICTLAYAQTPDAIAAKGETVVLTLHAQGAQIYECKAGTSGGGLTWQFREPVASLFKDGKTVGRHYAGPTWEDAEGALVAKVAGRAPAASAKDIPLLKLEVTERRGSGVLKDVSAIQRLNTKGGVAEGACEKAGDMLSVPYSADYAFLRKGS